MTLAEDIQAAARRIERTANGRRDPTTAALADLLAQITEHYADRLDSLREDVDSLRADVDANTEAIGYLTPMVASHITLLANHESRLDALEGA